MNSKKRDSHSFRVNCYSFANVAPIQGAQSCSVVPSCIHYQNGWYSRLIINGQVVSNGRMVNEKWITGLYANGDIRMRQDTEVS